MNSEIELLQTMLKKYSFDFVHGYIYALTNVVDCSNKGIDYHSNNGIDYHYCLGKLKQLSNKRRLK